MRKATIEDLLERKLHRENLITKEIDVPLLGMSLVVKKLPLSKVLALFDQYQQGQMNSLSQNLELYKELIYLSTPILQDKKLQDAYECAEPYDIVTKILDDNIQAIGDLGAEISKFYGIGDEVIAELKN